MSDYNDTYQFEILNTADLAKPRKRQLDPTFNPDELDSGIRTLVVELRSAGFNTADSGDGVSKPPEARVFNVPHVACSVSIDPREAFAEADRLQDFLDEFHGDGWRVEATYFPCSQCCILLATKAEP